MSAFMIIIYSAVTCLSRLAAPCLYYLIILHDPN